MIPLLGLLLILTSTQNSRALEIGDKMPNLNTTFKNVDGSSLKLRDIKGKRGTLIIFAGNMCPVVNKLESRIKSIGTEYQPKGVGVVAFNSNDSKTDAGESVEMMKKKSYPFPYLLDQEGIAAEAFGATKNSECFLFNSNDRLIYHGALDDNHESAKQVKRRFVVDAIKALLKSKKPQIPSTKPVGSPITKRSKEII